LIPESEDGNGPRGRGYNVGGSVHRFNIHVSAPTNLAPLSGRYTLGEAVGTCTGRWVVSPDSAGGRNDAFGFDLAAPQKLSSPRPFTVTDGLFRLGDGHDGFRCTGAGEMMPAMLRGRRIVRIAATGTLSDGFGKFERGKNGFFISSGTLGTSGFRGLF